MTEQTTDPALSEKILKDSGWKLYSKQGRKKFWESPHDGKVYPTALALMAQRIADQQAFEKRQAEKILESDGYDAERFSKFENWEVDIDKLWPPPKKKKSKKIRQTVSKNIKDLGF